MSLINKYNFIDLYNKYGKEKDINIFGCVFANFEALNILPILKGHINDKSSMLEFIKLMNMNNYEEGGRLIIVSFPDGKEKRVYWYSWETKPYIELITGDQSEKIYFSDIPCYNDDDYNLWWDDNFYNKITDYLN